MNKLLVLAIFAGALSPCLGQDYGLEWLMISEELDSADVEEHGCHDIAHLEDIEMRHFYGEWHLPSFLSNNWIRYMSKRMGVDRTFKKQSQKIDLKPMPKEQMAQNDNATIWVHSKCRGTELNLACTPTPNNKAKWFCRYKDSEDQDGDSWVYVVDSDYQTWVLVVRCFLNNRVNWAVFSKTKELGPILGKFFLKEVAKMGFQVWDYDNCWSQ